MSKPFHTIAVPHKDILEGRFTLDVYAADLWQVYHKTGPEEYYDSKEFFKKTYLTRELINLMDIVGRRIKGQGGDPIIQLQTPFGGGKTHTLIALYHKAAEWGAKSVVIVGEDLNSGSSIQSFETPWGILEKQLSGNIKEFSGHIPPGGDQIRKMLEKKAPVIILMDEMIPYLNKCDAVKVQDKNFASLVLDFIQTLTNVVSSINNVSFILTTTPSNPNDKSQRGVELVSQLQNAIGRIDVGRSPVQDEEISSIIRKRLFSNIKETEAKKIVDLFVDYAEKNSIIPVESEKTEYRKRFLASYPFLPEVIDILFHKWGSFPNFQRTRGVLRLLALVINAVKDKNIPYISLADFDLGEDRIRLELLKHIGSQFDSIIDQDIIGNESGSKKVDKKVGASYQGLKIGTRTSTTIFLYSFSGGHENGITLGEAKRIATTMDNPASIVSDVFEDLKNTLFFLKNVSNKYLFSTEPNLNQILNIRMENVIKNKITELQQEIFKKHIGSNKLKTFYLPANPNDVPDSSDFKLIVLKERSESSMRDFLEKKGITPRTNRNTIFFLSPIDSERLKFENNLRRYVAYKEILGDQTLNLSVQQQQEIRSEIKKIEDHFKDDLRNLYRLVYIPEKNFTFKEFDLGIPTVGDTQKIDDEIYSKLRSNGDILEKMAPIVIKEKFLKGREYVEIEPIYISSLTTPGETRYADHTIIDECVKIGVRQGVFGVGTIVDHKPVCKFFQESLLSLEYGIDIIIDAEISRKQKSELIEKPVAGTPTPGPTDTPGGGTIKDDGDTTGEQPTPEMKVMKQLTLDFEIPVGKASSLLGMINFIQKKFANVSIKINAQEGEIDKQDYEDKIKETLRQMGIE